MSRWFASWNGRNPEVLWAPITIGLLMVICLVWVIMRRRQKPTA